MDRVCGDCFFWADESCGKFGGKYPKNSRLAMVCKEFKPKREEIEVDKPALKMKKKGRPRKRR